MPSLPIVSSFAPSAGFLVFKPPTASLSFLLLGRVFPSPLPSPSSELPRPPPRPPSPSLISSPLPPFIRKRRRWPLSSTFPGLYLPLFPLPLPDLALDTAASLLCSPHRVPAPSPFSSSLPISLSCRGWNLEADHLTSLLSPRPPFTCATASLLDLIPSLSVSSSPTRRLPLPSSPSPSSPSSTTPLSWSPSATLFLTDVLPVGDLGIRKGVQILRYLRTANPISPLTSLLSLSSIALTTTIGPGPSSIADHRRLLDLLLRRCHRSLTVDFLPSCLRLPPLPPLPVILTVNLPKFLCLVVLPPWWLATAGGVGILVRPWCLAVVIWSWRPTGSLREEDTKPSLFG